MMFSSFFSAALLYFILAQDRMEWRRLIGGNRPTHAEHGKKDVKRWWWWWWFCTEL